MANIPITTGSGAASIAGETIGGVTYQQIEVSGKGGASTLGVNPDGSLNASVIGVPAFTVGGGSVVSIPTGSVITVFQSSSILSIPTGSVITVLQSSSLIAIASGSVLSVPTGSVITVFQSSSILSIPTGSTITVLQNSSILSVPVGSVITVFQSSSILSVSTGSVITVFQSSSVITTWKDSSILAVPVGSVISVTQGSVAAVITSIATANGGLPLWSPLGSRVQGTADLRTVQGTSVAVIAAQGANVFTYIDHVQVLNFGSSSVLVTIADITTSILGYTIAPAGGGSNYDTFYKTAANNPVTASLNGTASVLVSMQGFISKT